MIRPLALLVGLLVVTACSDPTDRDRVILKNPDTGQTVECSTHALTVTMYKDVKNCAAAYEKAGYERVADYKN